jgi:hypothetical protein
MRHRAHPRERSDFHHGLLERVRAEYREMPGLCLSLPQGVRLPGLDQPLCSDVFRALVRKGFLRETSQGHYRRAE